MKSHSTSSFPREVHLRTVLNVCVTPVRMAVIKKKVTTRVGEDVGKEEPWAGTWAGTVEGRRNLEGGGEQRTMEYA